MKRINWVIMCALALAAGCSKATSLPLQQPRLSMPKLTPSPSGTSSPLQSLGINGQSPDEDDTPNHLAGS
jgi:hypothetical protein